MEGARNAVEEIESDGGEDGGTPKNGGKTGGFGKGENQAGG
jgi:hypothetical protein